ncbi:MAG: hypothetical protein ABFD91_17430, partial [Anaerohalosphaeraceae bacterium]
SDKGHKGNSTSEQILRVLVVQFIEQASFRDIVVLIENSEFLRNFIRLGPHPMMDFNFLNKAFGIIGQQTWAAINQVLVKYAEQQSKISSEKLCMDTTVYEANIHYPTDSSLLWDSFRTLAGLLCAIGRKNPRLCFQHRFHDKKVKKLAYFIARNGASPKKGMQRWVKAIYHTLIDRVGWIARITREVLITLGNQAGYDTNLLRHYLSLVEKIIDQAEKRVFQGVMPPAADKGFYESMTQIVAMEETITTVSIGKKGRRNEQQEQRESCEAFKEGQRFRAGCEDSISILKTSL